MSLGLTELMHHGSATHLPRMALPKQTRQLEYNFNKFQSHWKLFSGTWISKYSLQNVSQIRRAWMKLMHDEQWCCCLRRPLGNYNISIYFWYVNLACSKLISYVFCNAICYFTSDSLNENSRLSVVLMVKLVNVSVLFLIYVCVCLIEGS